MALPTTREETAIAAAPVKPNTINAMQDCHVGQKFAKHWRYYGFPRGSREVNTAYDTVGGLFSGCIRATGALNYAAAVPHGLPAGTLIDGLKISLTGVTAGGAVSVALRIAESTLISSLAPSNPGNGVEAVFTEDPASAPYTTVEGAVGVPTVITLAITLATANYVVNWFALKVSRL